MDKGAENYAAYLNGDGQGLVRIVDEYKDGLTMYLNGVVRDTYLAEDICMDTFFRLMVKRPRYDPGQSSFRTWLYGIGRRLAYNAIKRNKRVTYGADEAAEEQADEYSLEEEYVKSERHAALYACLGKLPPDERELIWLSYFEDMSVREISKITGARENGVAVKLFRIRKKLKKMLEERGFGNENDS